MERLALKQLNSWKVSQYRKPLLLKGARQVGKTHLLRHFGKQAFANYHYVNFESDRRLHAIFEQDLDPKRLIEEISFYLDKKIDLERHLVIFDEIQDCPSALTSLKYFQEKMPQLALCAAGSLLGVHLNSGSYPVGKVDELTLHPMSFYEFLMAIDDERSLPYFKSAIEAETIPSVVHQHLWKMLKHYFIVGGLPEAVNTFRLEKDDLFNAFQSVREKQQILINAYFADMAKHAGKVNAMHLDRVWREIPLQLARVQDGATKRFKFKGVISGIDRYSRLVGVLDWLEKAGLIIKINIANKAEQPLLAYAKESLSKLMLFDVGILGAMAGLAPKVILSYQYGSYKGFFAENYVAQALKFSGENELFSWQEGRSEIEFLLSIDGHLLPVEVKSGTVTQAKSLKVFVDKYKPPCRIILSAKPLTLMHDASVMSVPLYFSEQLLDLIKNLSG